MKTLKKIFGYLPILFRGIFNKTADVLSGIIKRIRKARLFYKVAAIYLLVMAVMIGAFMWRAGTYYPEIPLGKEEFMEDNYPDYPDYHAEDHDEDKDKEKETGHIHSDRMPDNPETEDAGDAAESGKDCAGAAAAREVVITELIWPAEGGADNLDNVEVGYGEFIRHDLKTGSSAYAHTGIDISLPEGSSVLAAADGEVVLVKDPDLSYGKSVLLRHAGDIYTFYGSLARITAEPGQKVTAGETIGEAGNTAPMDSGLKQPYLHFELKIDNQTVDPLKYLRD